MSKDDGSLNLRGGVTPLMELMLRRRSVRKYAPGNASPRQVEHVLRCAEEFATRSGFRSPRLLVVQRGSGFEEVVKGAMAGLVGKINPWLAFTRAEHMILCGTVYPEAKGDARPGVERALKEAAMTLQVAVLAATEVGLATCWMAGINHERVELAHPMPDGARVVAISTLGLPPPRMGLSWDTISYHLVSRRRKPLEDLVMSERWEG